MTKKGQGARGALRAELSDLSLSKTSGAELLSAGRVRNAGADSVVSRKSNACCMVQRSSIKRGTECTQISPLRRVRLLGKSCGFVPKNKEKIFRCRHWLSGKPLEDGSFRQFCAQRQGQRAQSEQAAARRSFPTARSRWQMPWQEPS